MWYLCWPVVRGLVHIIGSRLHWHEVPEWDHSQTTRVPPSVSPLPQQPRLPLGGSWLPLGVAWSLSLMLLLPMALGESEPPYVPWYHPAQGLVLCQASRKGHKWQGLKGTQSLGRSWGWRGHRRSSRELSHSLFGVC